MFILIFIRMLLFKNIHKTKHIQSPMPGLPFFQRPGSFLTMQRNTVAIKNMTNGMILYAFRKHYNKSNFFYKVQCLDITSVLKPKSS